MNRSSFLITAFGKDRPGMVAGLSAALYDVGGNIEDASMTRLGGEFSMMLVVSAPLKTTLSILSKKLHALEKKLGLQISVKAIPAVLAHVTKQEPPKYLISVYGTDHPGIVSELTQALAKRKVSITDLQTKVAGSVKPLYVMLLEVAIPESADLDALRGELDDLRQKLNVEITLQDIESVAL
jgi:glycine cleavage system transcriptional repressor